MKIQLRLLHAYEYPREVHTLNYTTKTFFLLLSFIQFIFYLDRMAAQIAGFKMTFYV